MVTSPIRLRKKRIWKVFNSADSSRPPTAMAMKETRVRMKDVMDAVERHRPIPLKELDKFEKIAKDFEYVR